MESNAKPVVIVRERPSAGEIDAANALIDAATAADGVRPLSDQSMLHLRHGGDGRALSVLLYDSEGALAGYGHLEPGAEPSGELVVHPAHRGRGHGRELALAMLEAAKGSLRVWAHSESPAAAALARSLGFERVRALWKMRRPLADPLPEPVVPDGVRIRTFAVGHDEAAWLELNRRAFADHPEQGSLTMDDLARREDEPWFDPAGFFLAERDGALTGFHWTKVHDTGTGEVYVLGVAPDAQGTGLGRALTLVGLRHLRSAGLSHVMLYVDEANRGAVRLYESLGFDRFDVDVMYGRSARSPDGNHKSAHSS
ncbi:mycothiol synthase [Actinomadura alba]|uniref:Mycothiol acetyltransferase n=1 Tax=Actinomadura alba TaxID=406431 RepID=A0ABR7LNQ0_9ACTN|nr:mycothiol synthase [Actinomadura alba]MBC6466365.1 mycothiol synthase [Actinomadura alba]